MRELLDKSGLEDLTEQIFPYSAEFVYKPTTVIDPEDLIGTQWWSNETLV